jgi:hypothetical protein
MIAVPFIYFSILFVALYLKRREVDVALFIILVNDFHRGSCRNSILFGLRFYFSSDTDEAQEL